jgi:hypothetical protein
MNQCLKFTLPTGAGGMAAGYTLRAIIKKLEELQSKGQLGKFKTKTERYEFKVWFESDSDYSLFFLIWEPFNSWHKPILITETYKE